MVSEKQQKYILSLVTALLPVLSGHAATMPMVTEDDVLADIKLVHSVTHLDQTLPETPAAVTIIDRRMIDASVAVDVVDLLRLVPGLQTYFVNSNRPGVTYHTLANAYPRRLEVKVDGRSVYNSIFSAVEWSVLGVELDDINHIEVVRGANAPADGSNAFLASINIVTRSPLLDSGWRVKGDVGGNNIRNNSVSYAGVIGEINHRTTLTYRSNDGFDDFADYSLDDDADMATLSFNGLWTPTARDSLEFRWGFSNSNMGVGSRSSSSPRKLDYQYQHLQWHHLTKNHNQYKVSLSHNTMDLLDVSEPLSLYEALSGLPDGSTKATLYRLPDKIIIDGQDHGYSERWDAEFRAIFDQRDDFKLVSGFALRYDHVDSENLLNRLGGVSQTSQRLYTNAEWSPFNGVVLNGGIVGERDNTGTHASYRLASNFQFASNQTIRLAFNRGYRAPSLLEKYQKTFVRYDENLILDASVISDPDVNREQLSSMEIGYMASFDDAIYTFDLRVFRENLRDVIGERREQYPDVDNLINIRDNTETINIDGFEWQAQYRPNNKFLVHAHYSQVHSEGRRLYRSTPVVYYDYDTIKLNSPRHNAGLLINYVADNELSLSTMINYRSGIRHPKGSVLEGYTRIDIKAAKTFTLDYLKVELSFTAQNVGSDYFEFYDINLFKTRYVLGFRMNFF